MLTPVHITTLMYHLARSQVAADGLTLHVGLSCGELCFGILGGIDNYWECLMSGAPIGLVADALDEAKKQEVGGSGTHGMFTPTGLLARPDDDSPH